MKENKCILSNGTRFTCAELMYMGRKDTSNENAFSAHTQNTLIRDADINGYYMEHATWQH